MCVMILHLDPLCLLEINLGTTIIIMNIQVIFLLLLLETPAANTNSEVCIMLHVQCCGLKAFISVLMCASKH